MAKELIQPKTVYKATTYSHAVKRSNIVFISGQVAKDVEGKIVGKGDIGAQVEQVFRNPVGRYTERYCETHDFHD
jgi:enamine deaminase RidA (YjgF/YER057c/UK114 family)